MRNPVLVKRVQPEPEMLTPDPIELEAAFVLLASAMQERPGSRYELFHVGVRKQALDGDRVSTKHRALLARRT